MTIKKSVTAFLLSSCVAQLSFASSGDVYAIGGTGRASDGSTTGWQGAQVGMSHKTSNNTDVGVLYYNEGTPTNNHRDGFAVMGWYDKKITDSLSAQVGAGPYYSMNTTTVDGEQLNQKNVGALAAVAVLYRIHGSKFHLRAQYTHAQVPGSVNSDTIFVGAGYAFDEAEPEQSVAQKNIEFSVWGGNSHTTRAGANMVHGFQIEVRKLVTDHVAYSVSIIDEGNTGVADRSGVVGQVWYATPASNGWHFDVGAGPYIAFDKIENKTKLVSVASMRVSKQVTKTVRVGLTFNRVITGDNKDQDMFLIGVQKEF